MNKMLMTVLGVLAMIMVPALTMAQSKNGGHDRDKVETNAPSPNPSATEHADEKSKVLRDNHDMGKHKGQEMSKGEGKDKGTDKDKDKNEGDDLGTTRDNDKDKSIEKSKAKGKGKEDAVKGKDQKAVGKEKGAQTDADRLFRQVPKTKDENIK